MFDSSALLCLVDGIVPERMQQKLTTCLLGASLALASGLAVAKEYAVEIIVFDRLEKKISTAEQWDLSSARIAERLAEMATLAEKASAHKTVGKVFFLGPVRLNLLESGYRILNTTSWRQPTSLYQHAPLIPWATPIPRWSPALYGFTRPP